MFFKRKKTEMTELNARIDAYLAANYIEPLRSSNELRYTKPKRVFKARKTEALMEDLAEEREEEATREEVPCESQAMEAGAAQVPQSFMGQSPQMSGAQMFAAEAMPVMQAMEDRAEKKRSLEDVISEVSETWQESLFRLIDEKGYTDTEVYKRAGDDRKLFSKIRSNSDYRPRKNTAIAFALALKLNLDETKDFLMRAGYALSKSSRFDLIIEFFIENEVYDLITIDTALYDHNEQALSS